MDMEELIEIDLDVEEEVGITLPSPRLELDGVLSEQELLYIKSMMKEESPASLPLYMIYGSERIHCGFLKMDLDSMLQLKYIGMSKYFLYLVSENEETIPLLNPNSEKNEILTMLNFIRIRG